MTVEYICVVTFVGDHHIYDDDDDGDDDDEHSSGSGQGELSHIDADNARYTHRHYDRMLPPVPVEPHFNPHANDHHFVNPPRRRLPAQRLSTRRRHPVMYTVATAPEVYTTPASHVYFTRHRNYVGSAASPSSVTSLTSVVGVVVVSSVVLIVRASNFAIL